MRISDWSSDVCSSDLLKADGLTGARIGVVRDLMGYQPDVDAAMEKAIAAMQAEGATVVDADIATLNDWNGAEFMVLKYELKAGLARYLAESDAPVTSLAGLIEFNRSEEHTSELQSLMRISYAVFCLNKQT